MQHAPRLLRQIMNNISGAIPRILTAIEYLLYTIVENNNIASGMICMFLFIEVTLR